MQYLKLLKLLYIADRTSLREKGFPLTGDQAVAMRHGPVLSTTYNLIKGDDWVDHAYWDHYFSTDGYAIELKADPGVGRLSRYELELLATIYEAHKDLDGFDVSELTHLLPEWRAADEARIKRGRGSEPIPVRETLAAVGKSLAEAEEIVRHSEDEVLYFKFFNELTNASGHPAR
jgi:hypothetical protein